MSYEISSSRFCNVCLLTEMDKPHSLKLKKCNGCLLVVYCSPEHQRRDWKSHREFCHAVRALMMFYNKEHPFLVNGQPNDMFSMERAIRQVTDILRTILKRPLHSHEEEIISFPTYCEVCFNFDVNTTCIVCLGTSYCSKQHALQDHERHKKRCGQLQLYYCPYKMQPKIPPEKLLEELHKRVPDILETDIIGAYECISSKVMPKVPTACADNYQLFSSVGDFSCMGTILFSLEFIDANAITGQKFVIFILGAVDEQSLWFRHIQIKWFFLQRSNFTRLELHFIGPDVLGAATRQFTFYYKGADRTVICESHRMLYQDFTKINRTKPSFIIIFNCGFSEYAPSAIEEQRRQREIRGIPIDSCAGKDTWSGGISQIIKSYGLPIVLTSLTRAEAELDFGAVQRIALTDHLQTQFKRLFDIMVNPYRDTRPKLQWQRNNGDDIFYRNGYIQGFTTHILEQ